MRRNFSRVLTLGDSLATITHPPHPSILQVESSPAQKLAFSKNGIAKPPDTVKWRTLHGRQRPASSSHGSAALRPPGPGRRPPLGRPVPLIASAPRCARHRMCARVTATRARERAQVPALAGAVAGARSTPAHIAARARMRRCSPCQ